MKPHWSESETVLPDACAGKSPGERICPGCLLENLTEPPLHYEVMRYRKTKHPSAAPETPGDDQTGFVFGL